MNAELNTNKINTLATFTDAWDDEVRIVEIDGTVYEERDGNRQPIRFDVHDGGGSGPDGDILNHENVQTCGWEVGEDHCRNFCSTVCMPSACFRSDLESDYDEDVVDAIIDFFSDDLEAADEAARENLAPYEKEWLEDNFVDYLDEQRKDYIFHLEYRGEKPHKWTRKQMIEDYMEELYAWERGSIIQFHDDDEVRKILAQEVRKIREFYPFRGVNYQPEDWHRF